MTKSVLLLNEFQKEWIDPRGHLRRLIRDEELFGSTLRNASIAVAGARENGMQIVHAGVLLSPTYAELGQASAGLRRDLPRDRRFAGEMADFVEPFAPTAGEFVVAGRTGTSVFTGSNLDVYLRNNRVGRVYIAGFAAHVCIVATLIEAYDKGYEVFLIGDACGSFTSAQRDFVIEHVAPHFGEVIEARQFAAASVEKSLAA